MAINYQTLGSAFGLPGSAFGSLANAGATAYNAVKNFEPGMWYNGGNKQGPAPQADAGRAYSGGSVLGASTGFDQPSGGSSGGSSSSTGTISSPQPQQSNLGDGGYGDYLKSLDEQISGLGDQRTAQEQVANNTYNQGLNTVNSQYAQGQQDLTGNREKTLRDLSNNLQQSWQSGNQYLGTRGASDSSAANQYAYALTKMGNQQRGDVQGQYDSQLFKLKNTYDTETKNLELSKNTQLQQISQWFADAQNQLKGQKSQVALQQSQQALNIAMQMQQQVQQQAASQKSLLDQWAANHATNFQQLAQQLGQGGQYQASIPTFQGIQGSQGSNGGVAAGYGQDTRKRDIYGNIIG